MKIVLAHGILGFGEIDIAGDPIFYFKGVKGKLEDLGHTVIAPPVDPISSVEKRAPVLAKAIKHFATGKDKACIIAHSMGGLDARRAIAHDPDVASRVHTLVTIGTPHFGSPIADLFSPAMTLVNIFGVETKALAELEGQTSLHDLTTSPGDAFEKANPDKPGITYHTIAGVGRQPDHALAFHTSGLFSAPFAFMVFHLRVANDGVVPANSAARHGKLWDVWPTDHADEIGWDLDHPKSAPSPEHLQRYVRIVERVQKGQ